jgi:hypothetical protein
MRPADAGGGEPAWLEDARRAHVPAAAIALGEVRLEMADALVTGLAGLVSRVTDPLASRLRDLGLDKPAALLSELPAKPEPADRLDGYVKVYQVIGLALVRVASATTIATADLERLPGAESIALRRPATTLTPDELLAARLDGRLSRYEAAWHRARHFERLSIDELLTEWPTTWGDGEAAPVVAGRLAGTPDRAVAVARDVLADVEAGQTAQLTAVRVLRAVGGDESAAIMRRTASSMAARPAVRRAAAAGAPAEGRGWRSFFSRATPAASADAIGLAIERLASARDLDGRFAAIEELEQAGDDDVVPVLRQTWLTDPAKDVRARAAAALARLGDSDAVESLVAALRDRTAAVKDAKAALEALGVLGDVRAVPEILEALGANWAGPLPGEALLRVGLTGIEPVLALVAARPELAQRASLQAALCHFSSPYVERVVTRRLDAFLDTPGEAAKAAALLKLAAESERLRESLARRIVARVAAPSDKAEKALVRAAHQVLAKATAVAGTER